MSSLASVLFDLDGVLVDSAHAWHWVVSSGARRFGFAPVSWNQFLPTFGQGVAEDQRWFFPGLAIEEVERYYDESSPDLIERIELDRDAFATLRELHARGLTTAVVTNTPRPLAERVLAQKGLGEHVDTLAAAGDALEKPAPDLILLALKRLRCAKERCLYVGDSETDRLAARAAQVSMVGLRCPGDHRIEALPELLELIEPDRTR